MEFLAHWMFRTQETVEQPTRKNSLQSRHAIHRNANNRLRDYSASSNHVLSSQPHHTLTNGTNPSNASNTSNTSDATTNRRRQLKRFAAPPDPSTLPPAHLLTTTAAQALADGWDASDVLECYWLTRRVYLQGVANTTISVTKTALGLRYRPPPWKEDASNPAAGVREIVLEYGPDRAGVKSELDVLPVILGTNNDRDPGSTDTLPYVSWANEGKVWYTQAITRGTTADQYYESATYMASVTGAVVVNVLRQAALYSSRRGAKRYQPWQVMLLSSGGGGGGGGGANSDPNQPPVEETATIKLRSSSDVDFVTYCLDHLARLGVVLLPVLRPTVYAVELTASRVSRETLTPQGKAAMAHFYTHLYDCVNQLASGLPAARIDDDEDNENTKSPATFLPTTAPTLPPRRRYLQDEPSDNNPRPSLSPSTAVPTVRPTYPRTPLPTVIVPPSPADPPPSSTAENAQKAAEEAQKAAQNATDLETAAQAAQQAVDAAQQAVDATVTQEALLRQEALVSGTAPEMAQTVSLCFSDPVYGLRQAGKNMNQTNTTKSTTAFIYWDSSYYFSVDLVHPYVRVVPTMWTPPHAMTTSDATDILAPDSHLVDVALAFVMAGLVLLGVILLCQRVSPSSAWRNQWLYKYQRAFFDPLNHNYDDDEMEEWNRRLSEERPLGQVGIPSSMGGTGAQTRTPLFVGGRSRRSLSDNGRRLSASLDQSNSSGIRRKHSASSGDLEMVVKAATAAAAAGGPPTSSGVSAGENVSDFGDDEFLDETSVTSHRLFRDPDMVEMPDLSSSSKVAVPVSLKFNRANSGRSDNSD